MKETLLMIPGTLCDESLFSSQVTELTDLVDCQIPDTGNFSSLHELATNILSSVKGNFSIMGLSYGGIIAFEILRQAPERVNKLVLLNTNYKLPSDTTKANLKKFVEMSNSGQFEQITSDILIDAMLYPNHSKLPKMRKRVLNMARNIGPKGFLNQVEAQLGRVDSSDTLKNTTCQTLIITGRQDNICPLSLHEEMNEMIPNSTLKIIEECGHLSTMEQPDQVNRIIRDWWESR